MHEQQISPGEIVRVRPLGPELATAQLVTLIKTDELEVFQVLVVPSGKAIPTHIFPGDVIVHCLEGRIGLTSCGMEYDLQAGELLYCSSYEPLSVRGVEDASVLLTVARWHDGEAGTLIG